MLHHGHEGGNSRAGADHDQRGPQVRGEQEAVRGLQEDGDAHVRFLKAHMHPTFTPTARDALEGEGPQRRLGRRLEEVAKAVGGGYCRLQMPWKLALAVRGTVAGHRLGALEEGGGGGTFPLFQCIPAPKTQAEIRRRESR